MPATSVEISALAAGLDLGKVDLLQVCRFADMLSNPEKKYSEYPVNKKRPEIKHVIIPKKGKGFKI